MSEIKAIGVIDQIPIKSKYEKIINYVRQNIRQVENGKIIKVQLERASETTNLKKALQKHIDHSFKVSVRTDDDAVYGYIQLDERE